MEERRAHRLTDRRARRRNETSGELGCVSVCGVGVWGGGGGRKSELKKRVGGTLGSERSKRNRARRGGKVVGGDGVTSGGED